MLGEEVKAGIRSLFLGDSSLSEKDLGEFMKENIGEVSRLVNEEDGAILSMIRLRGNLRREEVREAFPSFRKRKEENLIARGLLTDEGPYLSVPDSGALSLYPLLGEKPEEPARPRPDDLPKAVISIAAHRELRERDWRLGKAFSTDEFLAAFPSIENDRLKAAAEFTADSLTKLGIVRTDGKTVVINSSNSLSFLSLAPEAAYSYLLWPDIDERERNASFTFLALLMRAGRVRKDDFGLLLKKISLASGYGHYDEEDLFTLFIVEESGGWVYPLSEEKGTDGVMISSDWTINFSGSTPPLISLIAHLKTSDRMKIWLISKSSMKSAFALGYDTEEMTRYLESLSDLPVNSILTRRIESWETEYRSLIFERALVLRTDATRDRIISNIPQLSPYIIEHPKEGIFLMDYETEDEWRSLLYTFGFDMLAPTKGPEFREKLVSREFQDSEVSIALPEERAVPFEKARMKELAALIKDTDRSTKKLKTLMIQKGILFSEDMIDRSLPFRTADCWNYGEKHKLLQTAEKDKAFCILAEDYKGSSTVGTVEMTSPFEEGDQAVLGRTMVKISRLYRVFLVPVAFV